MTHQPAQMGMRHHLSRRLLPLAVCVGLFVSTVAPVSFWVIEHASLQHVATLYAEDLAGKLRSVAEETPGLWRYQSYKFMKIAREFHPDIDLIGFGVLDERGEAVPGYATSDNWKKTGRNLSVREELVHTLGTAPLVFNNRRLGTVEVLVADGRLTRNSMIIFGISLVVGTTIGVLIYRFPTRVVRGLEISLVEMFEKLQKSEQNYRDLNAELELKVAARTRDLLDAQEELVRREKLSILGQLSGSVGHELRNPLGVMSNAVYYLKMVLKDADDTTKEYLGIIGHEIDSSLRIIGDLMDFARTRTPRAKAVTVDELVDASLVRCAVPETVRVVRDLPAMLPLLSVDPLQIGQVLQNLIANGIQAMPAGGTVRISARQARRGGDGDDAPPDGGGDGESEVGFIALLVADTGEGISGENMTKLFQPLFTTKAKGVGLGLVVCRNLVEANGGRIEVSSSVGEGTVFTVFLPTTGSRP